MRFSIGEAMVQESPIEILKMRFAKGEITQEQYNEMLSALVPVPTAQTNPAPSPTQSSHPSYKDMAYIPPISSDSIRQKSNSEGIGKTILLLILGLVGLMVVVIIAAVIAAFIFGMGSAV